MLLKLSNQALKALDILQQNGYEAYFVGGVVRDYFLGIESTDIDIATNASIENIVKVFDKYKIIRYKKGKTVGVIIEHKYFEISTYDGNDIITDLSNRDFKVNAMAYHPLKGLLDPFGGIEEIKNKMLSTIKKPDEVINKDAIRILRAIRFECCLGFTIEADFLMAMRKNKELLSLLNKERLVKEINYILLSSHPGTYIQKYADIFFQIWPRLSLTYGFDQHTKWHHLDVFNHIMSVVDNVKPNLVLRLAALFHDIEKPMTFSLDSFGNGHFYEHYIYSAKTAKNILTDFKYNKKIIDRVYNLILYHDRPLEANKKCILRFLHDFKANDLDLYFDLKRADIKSQNPNLIGRLEQIDKIESYTYELLASDAVYSLKQLKISGDDLKKLGIEKENIAKLLDELLNLVIEEKLENNYQELLKFCEQKLIKN